MTAVAFLEPDAVLFLHGQVLGPGGHAGGVRDEEGLGQALSAPTRRQQEPGLAPDLFDLAAAYVRGIASRHVFHAGNLGTAWVAGLLFLQLNGHSPRMEAAGAARWVTALAAGAVSEADFAAWLRRQQL